MKKGKIIAIIIAIVVIIICIAIGVFFIVDRIEKEEIIKQELYEIDEISSFWKIDKENLNSKLNNIVSTGDYAIVEKALKTYLSDVYADTIKLVETISDEKFEDILTTNNYRNDGPNFTSSKNFLESKKNQIDESKEAVYQYFTEEKIMSYINNKGLDSYYLDLYRELAINNEEMIRGEEKDDIEKSIDSIYYLIEVEEEMLDFLIENKGRWKVQDESIVFDSDELITQYTNIINKLD